MQNVSGNPFEQITNIETAQELLDLAFSKAFKINPPTSRGDPLSRSRGHELNIINTAANVIVDRIERIIRSFPSLDSIHPFYQEITDLMIGLDDLKISLARLNGTVDKFRGIQEQISIEMMTTLHKSENKQLRKQAFGRFSSLVYQIGPQLESLATSRNKLTQLPGFNPHYPTVVITGVPNAGKSSFIKLTTSGKPEVASYPFTTKEVIFGHRKLDFITLQFVDTPGLLDRDFTQRNEIELQALLALKYLSDVMIYFVDPTEDASCTIEEQLHLFGEIRRFYPTFAFFVAITKRDIVDITKCQQIAKHISSQLKVLQSDIFVIHSQNEEGVAEILARLEELVVKDLLKSSKFRSLTIPEIDPEFLPLEDDPIWEDKSF